MINVQSFGIGQTDTWKMDKRLIFRIILLISLIVFFLTYNHFPKTDCEDCRFEIKNEFVDTTIDANEFMNLYFQECIFPFKQPQIYPNYNLSVVEP